MKTTISNFYKPSYVITIIERDDGKKKQIVEKASSMAFVKI